MNTKPISRIAVAITLLALVALEVQAHAGALVSVAGALDSVQQAMQTASTGWMSKGLTYAKEIFGSLAAIELSWAGAQYALQKNDLSDLLGGLVLKISALGFFFTILTFAPNWIPKIIDSFTQMGQGISGTGQALTPDAVVAQGMNVANALIQSLQSPSFSFTEIAKYLLDDIIVGISALVVVLAYGAIALQLLMTLAESYIVIGGGAVMLGFLGSRWTATFGEKYFGYAVSVGVKLMVLYLIVGFGQTLTNAFIAGIAHASAVARGVPSPGDFLDVGLGAFVFGGTAWNVPGLAGAFMNGSPSLSLGNMAAPAVGMASGIAAAGAAVAGTASGGVARLAAMTAGRPDGPTGSIGGMERLATMSRTQGSGTGTISSGGARAASGGIAGATGGGASSFAGAKSSPDGLRQTAAATGGSNELRSPAAAQKKGLSARVGEAAGEAAKRMNNLKGAAASRALHHATGHDGNAGGMSIRFNHPD